MLIGYMNGKVGTNKVGAVGKWAMNGVNENSENLVTT